MASPATITLPLNVAEVHKSTPPEFQWGIGAHWQLSCDDGIPRILPSLFDTLLINVPSIAQCSGDYSAGQIVSSSELAGTFATSCGGGANGTISASWDLLTCVAGQACSTGVDCQLGLTACNGGVETCEPAGTAADGTACGPGGTLTCTAGVCGP